MTATAAKKREGAVPVRSGRLGVFVPLAELDVARRHLASITALPVGEHQHLKMVAELMTGWRSRPRRLEGLKGEQG